MDRRLPVESCKNLRGRETRTSSLCVPAQHRGQPRPPHRLREARIPLRCRPDAELHRATAEREWKDRAQEVRASRQSRDARTRQTRVARPSHMALGQTQASGHHEESGQTSRGMLPPIAAPLARRKSRRSDFAPEGAVQFAWKAGTRWTFVLLTCGFLLHLADTRQGIAY